MSNIFDLFAKIRAQEPLNTPVEWIIAGLGNPGPQYARTRHNVGFRALDLLTQRCGARVDRMRFKALCGEAQLAGRRVLFLKPQTFMNVSGEALREALSWYKLGPERLLVLYDDVALPPGRIRVRKKGSDGGHNGIKSILFQLNTDAFPRVKIGVGAPPHPDFAMIDWVLGGFSEDDGRLVADALTRAADAAELVLKEGCDAAASKFNASGPADM